MGIARLFYPISYHVRYRTQRTKRQTIGPEERDNHRSANQRKITSSLPGGEHPLAFAIVGKIERLEYGFSFALWAGSFVTIAGNRGLWDYTKGV